MFPTWVQSTVSFIGGCKVSAVVEKIVEKGILFFGERVLPAGSEAAVRRVEMALPEIRAVMGVAEALKMKEPCASDWIDQFRQAAHAAENVLRELDVVKQDAAGGSTSSSKKRRRCAISDDILERLNEAVVMLDQAASGVDRLLQLANVLGIYGPSVSHLEVVNISGCQTTSYWVERGVLGRDVEKDKIIGWLKRPTQAWLSSFGVVGGGGLGKTALVQFACDELRGLGYFEEIIWVRVSTNFIVECITKKLLAELGETSRGYSSLDVLQESLKKKIFSKKILLILDDVWENEKREDWEQLIVPLRFVQKGSKILFTTRLNSVADLVASVINTEHEFLELQELREEELQLIFNSYALRGFHPNNHSDLQAIGDQIARTLRGCPFAAKVIGKSLNSFMDQFYWRRISIYASIIYREPRSNVVESLQLSFYNLPINLQSCVLYCVLFPPDYEFAKRRVIRLWKAEAFIPHPSAGYTWEDVGEDHFNHLLKKSFIEPLNSSGKQRYVLHDLMREFAIRYSKTCYFASQLLEDNLGR
ncbi:Disease resistance protein RGA2 [Rhynchospora pubera]|uniref:Disease resistance protein RGA2 n=1 Tax=Rhynchospora pubera TaxID=906938 RepID=A0AAV8FE71_9POAL|nr:Disease resistance protein RGA2 [Rhynchospora pubera]